MIKAKVGFDGSVMHLNGHEFYDQYNDLNGEYEVVINGELVEGINDLEQAIKWCMEN